MNFEIEIQYELPLTEAFGPGSQKYANLSKRSTRYLDWIFIGILRVRKGVTVTAVNRTEAQTNDCGAPFLAISANIATKDP